MSHPTPDSFERAIRSRGIQPDEVVFAEPWQARVFALVLALAERQSVDWEEFRRHLIDQIAAADVEAARTGAGASYYESWLAALEALLDTSAIAPSAEIDRRADHIAANPPAPTKAASSRPVRIA
ncbi:MAG TPA: nitrile hydratase accessory protein [Candidatus Binataceae bacterium]|nr:nitrile hydratase accessory protein [Candidatus Binataceae bacterium]